MLKIIGIFFVIGVINLLWDGFGKKGDKKGKV